LQDMPRPTGLCLGSHCGSEALTSVQAAIQALLLSTSLPLVDTGYKIRQRGEGMRQ